MSQKREKEETELKVPESLPLTLPITPPPPSTPSHISDLKLSGESRSNSSASSPERVDLKISSTNESRSSSATSPESTDLVVRKRLREPSRCSGMNCRRKVGLMPFRCRCGDVFCSEHRYSDRHECTFDYKAAARETIARENPVVKAAKILKV